MLDGLESIIYNALMKSIYSLIGLAVGLIGLLMAFPFDSCAKVMAPGELESSRAHIRFSPEAEVLVKTAVKAEKEQDWRSAAQNYQKAIELYSQYLINASILNNKDGAGKSELYLGVHYFCQNALRNMPAEGRKVYRDIFEPAARHVLDNIAKGPLEINKLEQLADRYGLTESGRQALTILMRWYLERGEFYRALGYYRGLKLNHPQDAEGIPERNLIGGFASGGPSNVEWPTYCGNNTRSKIMSVPPDKLANGYSFFWSSYFKLPDHILNLSRRIPNNQNIYYQIIPQESIPYFPVVNNNLIYLPTGSGIYAFKLSEPKADKAPYELKVKWKVEYDTSIQGFQEERTINTATLSADGQRLYAPLISSYEKYEPREGLVVKYPFPRRSLFCFDTVTAKALWTTQKVLSPKNGNDNFEDIVFPIAPAEEDDVLYVAGLRMPSQIDIPEHYLFAINARTGAVYFKTFIGSGILETNLFNNPSREPIASAVTVDSDNIYYCSQMGIITAVDRYNGNIKWLKKYEEYPIVPTWPSYRPPHLPLRWINNPIIRVENTSFAEAQSQVLVTAVDSPFLYLLSGNTGEELWRWNGDDSLLGNIRHLLGVKDGFLVISGETGLICLNLAKDGNVEWRADDKGPFGKDARFIGKGAIINDRIYISSDKYAIYEIQVKTGKLISRQLLPGKEDAQFSANLLVAGAFLIRNSNGYMNIYRIEDKKEIIDEKAK